MNKKKKKIKKEKMNMKKSKKLIKEKRLKKRNFACQFSAGIE